LYSWEQSISSILHLLRLDSIKSKILVFTLSATLIPAVTMGSLYYMQNKQFVREKITHELRNVTSHTARELNLWLKERFYDLRVFSSSYEVSENVDKILRLQSAAAGEVEAQRRLQDYLKSVWGKFVDYEELMVVDPKGQVVASSADKPGTVKIRADWLKEADKQRAILGEPYWDEALKKAIMMIVEPIKAADGRFLGLFAAKINFGTIGDILENFALGKTGQVYLITPDGTLILSSRSTSLPFMQTKLAAKTTRALFENKSVSLEYTDYLKKKVVGTLKHVPLLDWAVVAQIERGEAFGQIVRLRNLTLLMVSGLLLGIGLTAYLLGLTIVRPLDRLTHGAAKVADGNLEVDLPVVSRGELRYLFEAFNHMVARLRQGRKKLDAINETLRYKNQELEQLSVTDGLTGLHNHKHLIETLARQVAQAERYNHPFSVLMIDVDHFKKYNDTYGHPAGDDVLVKIASILKESVRTVDYAARYGGEEFLLVLSETPLEGALEVAERIRASVTEDAFGSDNEKVQITVSIGVAEFPANGDSSESIMASADAALYKAKRRGRNRVVEAASWRKKTKKLSMRA
jgi:diguanylate cyclase (GGDEF)-like protein